MNKVIFIGKTGCGKTTLTQAMNAIDVSYHKTQQVMLFNDSIDTPGEFLESQLLFNHLVSAAAEAKMICFVQSAKAEDLTNFFPPLFSSRFPGKQIIGVVTKIDLAGSDQIAKAEQLLRLAGASRIFRTSVMTGTGLEDLFGWFETEGIGVQLYKSV
ncbi:EutP/PduV family microcompartment system protein [Sporolactobacillus shoreicorticis]|uniref:EutP/PduV family microcompartment system protein n=1 Tax=Sporolactobacillus shoreicorticis TaxID=1923877 RepID=A0ABW5S5N2_9BACL|nr:EutP/PduV family microcompartment system protein [Sporolactobacillus shoreicorticis]MCO7124449.1 EutP/PduV family microcompartment system protein [Sporolactobacillus shoreicorticis]